MLLIVFHHASLEAGLNTGLRPGCLHSVCRWCVTVETRFMLSGNGCWHSTLTVFHSGSRMVHQYNPLPVLGGGRWCVPVQVVRFMHSQVGAELLLVIIYHLQFMERREVGHRVRQDRWCNYPVRPRFMLSEVLAQTPSGLFTSVPWGMKADALQVAGAGGSLVNLSSGDTIYARGW